MSSEFDTAIHLGGCCCLACAEAAGTTVEGEWSGGETDPLEPVGQNAGSTSFSVSTISGDGISIGADEHGATATVTVSILGAAEPNGAPVAVGDTARVTEGEVLSGNVLANDSDPDGDLLRVTAVEGGSLSATLASGATVLMNEDGTFSYGQNGAFDHLETGETATDSFTYTISDEHGARSTATVTISINGISPPNTAPVAVDDTMRGAEGAALSGNVLANDTDPDGDALRVVGVEGGGLEVALASGATVSMTADGRFVYTQNGAFEHLAPGEIGTDAFSYTVADERGATSTATVTLTIDGVEQDSDLTDLLPRPGDLTGSSQGDWMRGDRGSQAIFGFAGDDTLEAKHGLDILVGGAGNDRLRSDKNNATIHYFGTEQRNGVVEIDTIDNFRAGIDAINLGGGAVSSVIEDGRHTTVTLAGDGDQIVIRWFSEAEAIAFLDTVPNRASDPGNSDLLPIWGDLTGTGDSDELQGGATGDRIFGLGSSDWLYGNGGDDIIVGGAGNDKLWGGEGADTFVFQRETRDGVQHRDAILDYGAGDRLQLIECSIASVAAEHNGLTLTLAGDGDQIFIKHVYSVDDLDFC